MQKIFFHSADKGFRFDSKTSLKNFIVALFKKEKKALKSLHYVFCSDDYLLNINKTFLQHDYYTDIITFDLSESDLIDGEVYISLDRVKDNSIIQKTTLKEEILRVIFHGALHLCGYKDKTKKQASEMRLKENHYLSLYKKSQIG
jgi:rRNA maturation RNase YbeY